MNLPDLLPQLFDLSLLEQEIFLKAAGSLARLSRLKTRME